MTFGLIVGTVVSTKKSDSIRGTKYLLAAACSERGAVRPGHVVALDLVGAGMGELVLIAQGSSARQHEMTKEKAIDAVIVGIVDLVEKDDQIVYRKSGGE